MACVAEISTRRRTKAAAERLAGMKFDEPAKPLEGLVGAQELRGAYTFKGLREGAGVLGLLVLGPIECAEVYLARDGPAAIPHDSFLSFWLTSDCLTLPQADANDQYDEHGQKHISSVRIDVADMHPPGE